MKASRIIGSIIAIAIGLVIAVQLTQKQDNTLSSSEATERNSVQTSLNESTDSSTEKATESLESNTKLDDITELSDTLNNTDLNTDGEAEKVAPHQTSTKENTTPMITFKTNKGDIEITLNAEKAPLSAANFLKYAKEGQYEGTIFHRVIPGFMIQGGGFEPGMKQKEVGAPIPNEANNGLKNDKYTLAMARTNEPHSATAQFFINATDNDFLNHSSETPSGWGYAVFGEVVSGKEVVDAIEGVATSRAGHHGDVPVEDVIIESVIVAE